MFVCPMQPGMHTEFIVYPAVPSGVYDLDGSGIIVDAKGKMTNRFSDGVIGTPKAIRDYVEDETSAVCVECGAHVDWQHV
jgi:hypothetical protein